MLLDYDNMATNIVRWMKTKFKGYRSFAGNLTSEMKKNIAVIVILVLEMRAGELISVYIIIIIT